MNTTRRQFLSSSSVALAALGSPLALRAAENTTDSSKRLRVCFFTDAHLPLSEGMRSWADEKRKQQERIRTAFDKANAFNPDVYIFGGDNVFDISTPEYLGDTEKNAPAQFENWKKVVEEKVRVPHHSVIGNHDIWYTCPAGETHKSLAIKSYGMPGRFYAWKMGGWKFIMLDTFDISAKPLDAEQMAWLEKELEVSTEPVCVVTHAPILSITTLAAGGKQEGSKEMRELFFKNPNVRLALSGHNHMIDCCQMDKVTYICGGAVCGSWWRGDYSHFPPAFLILDLASDGRIEHQTIYWEKPATSSAPA